MQSRDLMQPCIVQKDGVANTRYGQFKHNQMVGMRYGSKVCFGCCARQEACSPSYFRSRPLLQEAASVIYCDLRQNYGGSGNISLSNRS